MALAPVIDKIDSVPEAVRGAYVEREGKFYLDVEFEDTTGLKKALQSERDLRAKHEKEVKAWNGVGKTREEIAELLAQLESDSTDKLKKKGDFDALLGQHKATWEKEKGSLVGERDTAVSVARKAVVDASLLGSLGKAKVTGEGNALLPQILGKRVQLEFVDGEPVSKILAADGKTPMAGSGADGSATYDDLVKEAVKTYPSLFEGTGAGGGGKPPGSAGRSGEKTITRADFEKLGPLERATIVKTHKLVD